MFVDFGNPLPAPLRGGQGEAVLLIQVARGVQLIKGPEGDLRVALLVAKAERRFEQALASACAAQAVGHDEPAQVGALR